MLQRWLPKFTESAVFSMTKKSNPTKTHYAIQEQAPPADTNHIRRKFLDVRYAFQSPAQLLDIYLPDEDKGPFPVILALHGGAFMGCDKADMQVLPMLEGLKRDYAIVSANYRMSGEAKFPALVWDVKAAVRWIRANAGMYDFNPERIAAWGGSAGGYLASMLGTSAEVPELQDLRMGNGDQPANIQAVVCWFGPTNFLKMDEQFAQLVAAKRRMAELTDLILGNVRQNQIKLVDVNDCLRSAIAMVRYQGSRAKVTFDLQPGFIPKVKADALELEQVFQNVLLNAIQQMARSHRKGGRVTIQTQYLPGDQKYPVKLRFIDTGPGVHQKDIEKIFEPMFTTKSAGTGMGLYICRQLLGRMSAQICVEKTAMLIGTTFLIEFPKA